MRVTSIETHIALPGETFDMIAHRVYGNDFYDHFICDYNDPYSDRIVFEGGEPIRVPIFANDSVNDVTLAPWRRDA